MAAERFNDEVISLEMLDTITKGLDFTIPDVDWVTKLSGYPDAILKKLQAFNPEFPDNLSQVTLSDLLTDPDEINPLTIELITDRHYGGTGIFDAFMESFHNHIGKEFESNRITGAEYAQSWLQGFQTCIQTAVQYAGIMHENDLKKFEIMNSFILHQDELKLRIAETKDRFALEKAKLTVEILKEQVDCIASIYNLAVTQMQLSIAQAQAHQARAQYAQTVMQLGISDANYGHTLQGITSYRHKDNLDGAKLYSDAFIALKGINESIETPEALTGDNISSAITSFRTDLGL